MNYAKQFSSKVAEKLTPKEHPGSFIEIASIILLITNEILPLIRSCMEEDTLENGMGTALSKSAAECRETTFRGRLRKARLGLIIRRSTSRQERELLGGTTAITNAYIDAACDCTPTEMASAWNDFSKR